MTKRVYGKITQVTKGSPAYEVGIRPGDELESINSQPVRDMLDYRYLTADEQVVLIIRRDGERFACFIFKDEDEDLGIEFEEELFDGLHKCRNNCIFCFVQQMPKGLRKSLYMRDDDYRLSLAQGNFITLSNLSDDDMDRIRSQRMSPLYVSVHTTDPDLRARMLRNENAGRVLEQLRSLAEARITMQTQIVLCPGVNDGEHLERTVRDLASLHPWVESIAIVPVGLTKYREGLAPLRSVDSQLAREVLGSCEAWQREFESRLGTKLVFPSDEFYLLAGEDLPPDEDYEGYPQLENGVGISRLFLDELKECAESPNIEIEGGRYVLVTGMLAVPMVQRLADYLGSFDGVSARVLPVGNRFLGESVTVAGLLSGRDIAEALRDVRPDETALIPDVALNSEELFLDDMTVDELQKSVDARIIVVPASPRGVIERIGSTGNETCTVSCVCCTGT